MVTKKHSPPENLSDPVSDARTVVVYSNYAGVQTTSEEFIFRFCQRDMNEPARPIEVARIYVSMGHAKRLLAAMAKTLQAHEELFGEIPAQPALTPEGKKILADHKKQLYDAANK